MAPAVWLSRSLARHSHHHVRHCRYFPRTTFDSRQSRTLFTSATAASRKRRSSVPLVILSGALIVWLLYPTDNFAQLAPQRHVNDGQRNETRDGEGEDAERNGTQEAKGKEDTSAWTSFTKQFEMFSTTTNEEWPSFSDRVAGYILPEWWRIVPGYMRKLQRELSMAPGSLADEIWNEAHDPNINPEIQYSAKVRVSNELCTDETRYLERRRRFTKIALARYLDLEEEDLHPDDVPTIAMACSGGGLRALVAGTGSYLAAEEDGLFDCVTYTAGVSGSCWLQLLYLTSFGQGRIRNLVEHLKARAGTHIAYPPTAFEALTTMPTNKLLLSGLVEKLMGDAKADFGLVDIYGLLLGARYLVPKGQLGVNDGDFKISNQRRFLKFGEAPLPIYTAVRHEIPDLEKAPDPDVAKEKAKKEAWFQWFEITPYEFFCEDFGAGIPTWAAGRVFENGQDVPPEHGFHLPELRTPFLMGIFGSAFCATLSHYYNEIRPLVKGIAGFKSVDEMISGRNDDLSKVHPFDPAIIPNFVYKMDHRMSPATPQEMYDKEHIQLMDAGMSNNLPIYPLLRPGRDVDAIIAFDASADTKEENWLSVADGVARQRGIKGWPVGVGWPKPEDSPEKHVQALEDAQASSPQDAERKVEKAKTDQKSAHQNSSSGQRRTESIGAEDLGYCTVWVGSTTEQTASSPPQSSQLSNSDDSWKLMEPDAGLSIIYLPFVRNDKVADISPGESDYLSTWNFIYTHDQIDKVVELAKANYDEGKEQIKSTIRAIYERKKKIREEKANRALGEKIRKTVKREGDQFS